MIGSMSEVTAKHKRFLFASLVALVLLSSSLVVPTLPAFADNGNGKTKNNPPKNNPVTPKNDPPKSTHTDDDDSHKKGKKDPDKDKDNDKKACKHGDTNKKGKYRHNCDSDNDFKP